MENIRQMTNKDLFILNSYLIVLANQIVLSSLQSQTPSQKGADGRLYLFPNTMQKIFGTFMAHEGGGVSVSPLSSEYTPIFAFIKNGQMFVFRFLMR